MDTTTDTRTPPALTFSGRPSSEGRLVAPPPLVQKCWDEDAQGSQALWATLSPASDPSHELGVFHTAWHELAEIIANSRPPEVPEVFQMPPVPTKRVHARVRHVGQAPFVFVDELAE